MDSNHDKVIQSHLCYHYTTRQSENPGKFGSANKQEVNYQKAKGRRQESGVAEVQKLQELQKTD
jgi:hypothetical protein